MIRCERDTGVRGAVASLADAKLTPVTIDTLHFYVIAEGDRIVCGVCGGLQTLYLGPFCLFYR